MAKYINLSSIFKHCNATAFSQKVGFVNTDFSHDGQVQLLLIILMVTHLA